MELLHLPRLQPPPATKPTYYVDASILKKSSCMREVIWTIVHGYKVGPDWATNYKAGYGSAFHRGIELYYSVPSEKRTEILPQCIDLAQKYYEPFTPYIANSPKEFRTMNHLVQTLIRYHEIYGNHDALVPIKTGNETGLLETRFLKPYYQSDLFDIVLTGTIDMVGEYYGELCMADHKTTGAYEIKDYLHGYKMNIQTQFYVHIFEEMTGKRLPFLINGVFIKKDTKKAREAGDPFDGVNFERSELIKYDDEQMSVFRDWLKGQLIKIQTHIEDKLINDYEPSPNFAACQQPFGRCKYYNLCSLSTTLMVQSLQGTTLAEYNPLHFSD